MVACYNRATCVRLAGTPAEPEFTNRTQAGGGLGFVAGRTASHRLGREAQEAAEQGEDPLVLDKLPGELQAGRA